MLAEEPENALREALASYAHEAWSGWMDYMFRRGAIENNGEWILPAMYVQRWKRQSETLYANLPEKEKDSDRLEADKMIRIFRELG